MISKSHRVLWFALAWLGAATCNLPAQTDSSTIPPWFRTWPRYETNQKTDTTKSNSPPLHLPPPPLQSSLPPWLTKNSQVTTASSIEGNAPSTPDAADNGPVVPAAALQSDPIILEEPLQLIPSPPEVTDTEITTGSQLPELAQQPLSPKNAWYYPSDFFTTGDWSKSAELGINGTEGNSQTMSLVAGLKLKRKTDRDLNDFRLTSQKTNTNGEETQNNTLLYYDYEMNLGESPWSLFVKSGLEYDEFRAFDLRLFVNSGLAYKLIRTKAITTGVRFGVGTSREFGGPDDRWVPELLFGFDHEHQINKRNKVGLKFDYYPEWTDFQNYRIVLDASWEYLLDDAGNLSIKLSALDRYDSTPNGAKPNDINYALLLMYKF